MKSTQDILQQLKYDHQQIQEEQQQREENLNALGQERDNLESDLEEIKRELDREKDLRRQMERTYGESVSKFTRHLLMFVQFSDFIKIHRA